MGSNEIYKLIPHRPPFLWIDKIIALKPDSVETQKTIPKDLEVFKGHYPDYPIMPGVLLCESVFQSGAVLISHIQAQGDNMAGVPVLTRIREARFKRVVRPGDTINIQVEITEVVGPAWFMKGKVSVAGKVVLRVNFACSLTEVGTEK